MTAEAYPLYWPEGWPRTAEVERSRYKVTYGIAVKDLQRELALLGGESLVLSSNVPLRLDGLPYADFTKRRMDDTGVAIYFMREGRQQVIACDSWDLVKDNIRAIGLTVAGLRAIQRAGATELLDRAFTGFKALPAPGDTSPSSPDWRHVLGCDDDAGIDEVKTAYRSKASEAHPDKGGSDAQMAIVNRSWEEARAELEA